MWRVIRIAVLLFILATVAQGAWLARTRTTEWDRTLHVVIYPINGDGSPTVERYLAGLRPAALEPIEAFIRREAESHGLRLQPPVMIDLAPTVSSRPPTPPFGRGKAEVIVWSLRLRYWAYWNDTYKRIKPDVRIFVSYFDPAVSPRLAHSTGLQKGLIGVVNAFATAEMDGSNNVVITHELLHTFGATDKYDFTNNRPSYPDGYADPNAQPLHPQARAEIMAGRIPISATQAEVPAGMEEVAIGARTALEINWVKRQ